MWPKYGASAHFSSAVLTGLDAAATRSAFAPAHPRPAGTKSWVAVPRRAAGWPRHSGCLCHHHDEQLWS